MAILKTEKKTQMWLAGFAILASLLYIFLSLGKEGAIQYIAMTIGFLLTIILVVEAGIISYFKESKYKKITFNDFITWIAIISATGVFLNSLLLLNVLRNNAPGWLLNYSQGAGITVGIMAAILAVILLITPKIE